MTHSARSIKEFRSTLKTQLRAEAAKHARCMTLAFTKQPALPTQLSLPRSFARTPASPDSTL